MTYDAADGYVVLFGGLGRVPGSTGGVPLNDTWAFRNGAWSNITASAGPGPGARDGMDMTYDAADGYVVAFGGFNFANCYGGSPGSGLCNDTWIFRDGRWTNATTPLSPPSYHNTPFSCFAYDAAGAYVLFNDGGPTWTYRAGTWTELLDTNGTPIPGPIGFAPSCTYDAQDGYIVLFGGLAPSGPSSETWSFHGGVWTKLSLVTHPNARYAGAMAYDGRATKAVLFGGENDSTTFSDTWVYSGGLWSRAAANPSPPMAADTGLADDVADASLILFGGSTPTGKSNQTWAWSATPPMAGLRLTMSSSTPLPNESVSFSETFLAGTPPFAYRWLFGDGSSSHLASPTHAYGTVGFYTVRLWVNDSATHSLNASALAHVYVPLAAPVITASSNPAVLGQPVAFTGTEKGGTAPYTYAWAFGDGGTGGNLPNITHVYTTNGPFTVVLTATDAAGAVGRGYLNISIALTVQALGNQTSGVAPLLVRFTSETRGGVPSYAYSWNFGDGSTSSVADPVHLYTRPGSYNATLVVADAAGHRAGSSWHVTVTRPGPGGSGPGGPTGLGVFVSYLIIGSVLALAAAVAAVGWRSRAYGRSAMAARAPTGFEEYRIPPRPEESAVPLAPGESDPAGDIY